MSNPFEPEPYVFKLYNRAHLIDTEYKVDYKSSVPSEQKRQQLRKKRKKR